MIDAGMVSIIIKVAGIGLTTKHLGKNLAEMQPTLVKMVSMKARRMHRAHGRFCQHQLYGSHICGEGGEYETLTLDCPLFKQRIT
jgi:diphthine-ammonia ligase